MGIRQSIGGLFGGSKDRTEIVQPLPTPEIRTFKSFEDKRAFVMDNLEAFFNVKKNAEELARRQAFIDEHGHEPVVELDLSLPFEIVRLYSEDPDFKKIVANLDNELNKP